MLLLTAARPLPRRWSAVVLSRPLWGDSSTYSYASTTKLTSFMSPEKPLPDSTKVPQCCATTPASLSMLAINSCFFHLIKRPVVLLQCKAFRGSLGNSFFKRGENLLFENRYTNSWQKFGLYYILHINYVSRFSIFIL